MAEESSLAIIDAKESYLAKPSTVGLLIYDEATFWLNYFLRTSTPEIPLLFSKHLYVSAKATFPEHAIF